MKQFLLALVAITILALGTVGLAYAHEGEPMYGCPDNFELHMADMDDMGDMDHHHVGLDMEVADKNGDGWICMKPVGADGHNHVHIDNNFPFLP
jgi:hypothetical protein